MGSAVYREYKYDNNEEKKIYDPNSSKGFP